MLKQLPLPLEMQEAHLVIEMGCASTLSELNEMPERLIGLIMLFKSIKATIEFGGELKV